MIDATLLISLGIEFEKPKAEPDKEKLKPEPPKESNDVVVRLTTERVFTRRCTSRCLKELQNKNIKY